jgi:hypothetical protein
MGKDLAVKLGCDPEVFIIPKGKRNIVSAHGLIKGTKYDPHNVLDGMVQVDGTALEFGIKPADSHSEWAARISSVMTTLAGMVPDHTIKIQPVAEFDSKYWEKEVPEDAKELGCEPDWNAWTGDVNPRPDVSQYPNIRTGAGHIHVGWCEGKDPNDESHILDCRLVVKQLDYYIGIWSLLWDKDDRRRNLYGKAGAFRPKSYGCEYRVPSNMWLSHTYLIDWIYVAARTAVSDLAHGTSAEKQYGELAQNIINQNTHDWKETMGIRYRDYMGHYQPEAYLKQPQGLRGPQWVERVREPRG